MLNLRRLALSAALIGALCAQPPRVNAQDAEPQAYRTTIDDAVREFASGHWEEARALFKRAHELSPNARTLRGMGMAAFEMRMYTQAIRELEAALRDTRKPLEGELRAQVSQLVAKSREFVGRVKLVVDPPDAKLLIDGKEPELEPDGTVLLDVGTHVISANSDRYKPTNLRLSVEGGMESTVRVPLEPLLTMQAGVPALDPNKPTAPEAAQPTQPPSVPREQSNLDTIAWVALAGAGAFGIASGVMYFGVGQSQYKEAEDAKFQAIDDGLCPVDSEGDNRCPTALVQGFIDDSGVKTSDTLATVFLIAAGASAVTSGVLFAIYASSEAEPARARAPSVKLALSPGIALGGQF